MGLTGQAATVDEILTGRENLTLIGTLYGLPPRAYVRETTERLFDRFDLTDAADRQAKTYCGGMRRRLDLAVSLLAAPPSCSSTSRRRGSTRTAGPGSGRSCASWSTRAPPSR
jgi:ABC-type multidrug transport system ATPase subunit